MCSGNPLGHTHHLGPLQVGVGSNPLAVLRAVDAKGSARGTHLFAAPSTQAHVPHLRIPQEAFDHLGRLREQSGLIEQPKGS